MDCIQGPTILDLKLLTSSSTETVTFCISLLSFGCAAGSLLAAGVYDKINAWLGLAAAQFIMLASSALVPWTNHVVQLAVVVFFIGISGTFLDTGNVYLSNILSFDLTLYWLVISEDF